MHFLSSVTLASWAKFKWKFVSWILICLLDELHWWTWLRVHWSTEVKIVLWLSFSFHLENNTAFFGCFWHFADKQRYSECEFSHPNSWGGPLYLVEKIHRPRSDEEFSQSVESAENRAAHHHCLTTAVCLGSFHSTGCRKKDTKTLNKCNACYLWAISLRICEHHTKGVFFSYINSQIPQLPLHLYFLNTFVTVWEYILLVGKFRILSAQFHVSQKALQGFF